MALNNGINIRLDPETRSRLEQLAIRYGVKSSLLIRQAITEKIEELSDLDSLRISPKAEIGSIAAGMSGGQIGQINVQNSPARRKVTRPLK